MTATGTQEPGIGGTVRMTWVTDHLAHALDDDAGEGGGT